MLIKFNDGPQSVGGHTPGKIVAWSLAKSHELSRRGLIPNDGNAAAIFSSYLISGNQTADNVLYAVTLTRICGWRFRMNRDQLYGGAIFVISLIIVVGYLIGFFPQVLSLPGWLHDWAVGLPVLLFVLVVLVIAMWIGWTMMTTPPPAPLEPETLPETKTEQKP